MGSLRQICQLKTLMKNQWLRTAQLEEIQEKKLRQLLKHAYANVPYYQKLLGFAKVKPEEIRTASDLSRIPILTKSDLLNLPLEQITAKNINLDTCVKDRTSGSTGMPVNFFFTRKDTDLRPLLDLRILYANRYSLRNTILAIVDARHLVTTERWFQSLGIMRKEHLSILSPVEEQIEKIRKMKPDIIWGVTSNLVLIANRIKEDSIEGIRPKAIYTMGEFLDHNRRTLIESAFGVAPFDHYGSTECGSIAWECHKRTGYHINTDCLIVECVNDGKRVPPGESGELIVTNLYSYAMPFIRYSVGDMGILSDQMCPCGRSLPLINVIEGRGVDCIVLSDGSRISPYLLTCAIENIPGILRYQIIQEEQKQFTVNFIKGEEFSQETISQIKEKYREVLGDDVEVTPTVVDTLSHDKSGKFRVVMSKLATD